MTLADQVRPKKHFNLFLHAIPFMYPHLAQRCSCCADFILGTKKLCNAYFSKNFGCLKCKTRNFFILLCWIRLWGTWNVLNFTNLTFHQIKWQKRRKSWTNTRCRLCCLMTRALVFVALDDTHGPRFKVESCLWRTFSLGGKNQSIDRAFSNFLFVLQTQWTKSKPQLFSQKVLHSLG